VVDRLQDETTRVAYELYEKSGRKNGNDLQNWLAAEKIVYFNRMVFQSGFGDAFALLEYKPVDDGQKAWASPKTIKPRPAGREKNREDGSRPSL